MSILLISVDRKHREKQRKPTEAERANRQVKITYVTNFVILFSSQKDSGKKTFQCLPSQFLTPDLPLLGSDKNIILVLSG